MEQLSHRRPEHRAGGRLRPLAYWVEKAHALRLELHAWVNPFRVTKKGGQAEYDGLADSNPARQHPEWVVRHTENNVENFTSTPASRGAELVIQGAEELVRNYDIDGIHLDDYFYPGKTFADEAAYAQSAAASPIWGTGGAVTSTYSFRSWTNGSTPSTGTLLRRVPLRRVGGQEPPERRVSHLGTI